MLPPPKTKDSEFDSAWDRERVLSVMACLRQLCDGRPPLSLS